MTVDVVIVGAGFTGLSTALNLSERGSKVAVLEGVEIGYGASGRNVGLVNAGMWIMPDNLPGVLGQKYGDRLLEELGNGPQMVFERIERHNISCEATRTGTLHCAVGQKGLRELKERAEQWQRRGAPVTLLSAEETAKKTGTRIYAGSLLDMRAGTIQPLAYVRGLAHATLAAGGQIFTNSTVIGTERQGKDWVVKTAQGSVRAQWIVVATNAYTKAPWPQIRTEMMHLPYFNLATKPLTKEQQSQILPERQGVWDTKTVLSSYRYDQFGRLVFGSVGALRNTGTGIHTAWAKRELERVFPQLGKVEFDYEWYGFIGMTNDSLPKLHCFDNNVIGFSGYNGRGIATGTVFGNIMARYINGDINKADLPLPVTEPEALSCLSLREAYYETGAQIAHLIGARSLVLKK
ncbi:FAD-binding oxidoreductase [Paenochrobactrum glaciei]|uniref:FAD-binding oxidoreductase n=1 Tax=Paenochrobactrum glaciei TaxID=486407 RepID=A0ABN1GKG4_9HYPH